MFCQTCGAKLRPTARFCNHCGKPVAERFGSALLQSLNRPQPPAPFGAPSTQETVQSPTTPELTPKPQTDQIAQRGTERQVHAKATAQEVDPVPPANPPGAPPGAITNVTEEVLPNDSFGVVSRASTLVEEVTLSEPPAVPESATEPLRVAAPAKPFFTRLLSPQSSNRQHTRLARAVPLVVLALLLLLIFAYVASK